MDTFREMIERRSDLQPYLFCRGFLLTDQSLNLQAFPFFGNWNSTPVTDRFTAYTHKLARVSTACLEDRSYVLFGHAYDPFTMEADESALLERIAASFGTDEFQDRIDELTGIFVLAVIEGEKVIFECDASGMQSAYYAKIGPSFFITSHAQLMADICSLEITPFAHELLEYKWYYRVMGPYMPADLTQFEPVRRIVPDHAYTFDGEKVSHKRFWPLKENEQADTEEAYQEVISKSADILKKNMQLVAEKWVQPMISLTGGIDSNTTFAAANGLYDKIGAFSYLSAPKEVPDVKAAGKIASHFKVKRKLYRIPENTEELEDYDEISRIIAHNDGYIAPLNENEIRKRVYLLKHFGGDVEVKSWVSETIRGYWYKHYGRKTMPPLSAKLFRNLYKIFIFNRPLAHKIDRIFETYIDEFEYRNIPEGYPPADMHYHEVTWGSWGGLNISDMKLYSDITIIYNNRKLLDLLFRVPLEKRIFDQHHLDLKKILNRELYDMNIRVINMKETDTRAFLLNCIFTANTILPF